MKMLKKKRKDREDYLNKDEIQNQKKLKIKDNEKNEFIEFVDKVQELNQEENQNNFKNEEIYQKLMEMQKIFEEKFLKIENILIQNQKVIN